MEKENSICGTRLVVSGGVKVRNCSKARLHSPSPVRIETRDKLVIACKLRIHELSCGQRGTVSYEGYHRGIRMPEAVFPVRKTTYAILDVFLAWRNMLIIDFLALHSEEFCLVEAVNDIDVD